MNNSELVQIADILPPTAPVSSSVDFLFYFFLMVAAAVVAALWYLRSSKQKLRRLHKQYQQGKIDNRQCAFQLAGLLSQEKSFSALSMQQKNQRWQEYSNTLQTACYSRQSIDDDAMSMLLREAERWL